MDKETITILEEMILGLKNKIQKRIDENFAKKVSLIKGENGYIQKAITYSSRNLAANQALQDIKHFEESVKKMLQYKGNDPNYLLLPTNQAAGLWFSKHPEENNKPKEEVSVEQ